jgi:hypothetical protein
MIYQTKNNWVLKTEKGLRFFKTEQEAAKAAGLDTEWEIDHGIEEEKDDYKTPEDDYESEEIDTEE